MQCMNGQSPEAVVIGAGPGGSVAATLLARRGFDTLLIERSSFPRSKLCGGCLAQSGYKLLDECGLSILPSLKASITIDQLNLRSDTKSLQIAVPPYRVVDRAQFDLDLVIASVHAGSRFVYETTAEVLPNSTIKTKSKNGQTQVISPKVIIIADGLKGTSLKLHTEFEWRIGHASRVGIGTIIDAMPEGCDSSSITMFHGEHGYLGLAPLGDGRAVVAAAVDPHWIQQSNDHPPIFALARSLGIDLGIDSSVSRTRGAPAFTRRRNRLEANNRIFLIGDSTGYIEPFTGEGMSWSIEDAKLVIEHAVAASTGGYQSGDWTRAHARGDFRRKLLCSTVSSVLRREFLTRTFMSVCNFHPQLTSMLSKSVTRLQQHTRVRTTSV